MRFSADSIVLQTGMDTNYILLRLSVTSTRQRYIFIAAMINLAREQNWIQVQPCISSQIKKDGQTILVIQVLSSRNVKNMCIYVIPFAKKSNTVFLSEAYKARFLNLLQ